MQKYSQKARDGKISDYTASLTLIALNDIVILYTCGSSLEWLNNAIFILAYFGQFVRSALFNMKAQ